MKPLALICLLAPLLCLAQGGAAEGSTVMRLPEELAAKTISLNPAFCVHSPTSPRDETLPLLIYLHGAGGIGTDTGKSQRQLRPLAQTIERAGLRSILVAPQASKSPRQHGAKGGWVLADLELLLTHLKTILPIDARRIYLTGNSMGGYGTIMWAGNSPKHFAAIAPMVGGLGPLGPKDVTTDLPQWGTNLAPLPMRAYYGADDKVVPPDRGTMLLAAIKAAGGTKAEVIVHDGGHSAGKSVYGDPAFFRWLFSHAK